VIVVKDITFPELVWQPIPIWGAITQRDNCIRTAWVSLSEKQDYIDHLRRLLDEARRPSVHGSR
jgi:hypothetical protein